VEAEFPRFVFADLKLGSHCFLPRAQGCRASR
jgi:hypothetical protein